MVSDLRVQAAAIKQTGDFAAVLELVKAGLSADTGDFEWLEFALQYRDAGDFSAAAAILRLITDQRPGIEQAYYELAFMHRLRGAHREASNTISESRAKVANPSFEMRLFHAHMLYACGAHQEGNAALSELSAANATQRRALDAMFAFGAYLNEYPLGRALILLDMVRSRNIWHEPAEVVDRILQAVRTHSPFALVRLGDGEGAMLNLGAFDEYAFRPLYDANRDDRVANWFGAKFAWRETGFIDFAHTIKDELTQFDIIGIPYEGWIRHEYQIASLLGVPSLVNIFRFFLTLPPNLGICSQQIHIDLHTSGLAEAIFREVDSVSIISCLEDLPALLARRFGLKGARLYRIPGEQGSRHILGDAITAGVHYPDRFSELQAELAQPHHGRVFLIAAGLPGKFYATTIRKHGGIALDLGSVVDAWTGRSTRPGYNATLELG
jgi:hypothetical protein